MHFWISLQCDFWLMPLRVTHRRVNTRSCSFQEAVAHSRINTAELIQALANNEAAFAPQMNICDCFHANVVDTDRSLFSGIHLCYCSKTLHLVLILTRYAHCFGMLSRENKLGQVWQYAVCVKKERQNEEKFPLQKKKQTKKPPKLLGDSMRLPPRRLN